MDLTNFNAKHAHVKDKCSKPKGSDQKIPNHALFAISPESRVCECVVSNDTDIYILMLYIAKNCNGNLCFRQGHLHQRKV